MTLNEP